MARLTRARVVKTAPKLRADLRLQFTGGGEEACGVSLRACQFRVSAIRTADVPGRAAEVVMAAPGMGATPAA
jgi:hypothetical protein